MIRILVTGSRHYDDTKVIEQSLDLLKDLDFKQCECIHGNCKGADKLVAAAAAARGMVVTAFAANWHENGLAAGPIRNQQMVGTNPNIILIFHNDIKNSKGTKDCIKQILKVKDYNPLLIYNGVIISKADLEKLI